MPQKLIIASMAAAGLVAITAMVDIVLGIPYTQKIVMDVLFLVGAAIVIYMGYDAYRDLT